jgi:AcrR family transcriptional regulator
MKDARTTIVTQALKLFLEHGYDGMSLSELTRDTGLSKGAIYHHFKDKDDLFTAAIEQFFLQFLPVQADQQPPTDFEGTVKSLVDGYAAMLASVDEVTPDRLAYFRFILAIAPKIQPQLLERMNAVRNHLIATLSAEATAGRLRSDRPATMLADQILGLIEGASLLATIAGRSDPAESMRETVMDFVATLLR